MVWAWGPVDSDGAPASTRDDYREVQIGKHFSLGLVDFCPCHGVNVSIMHPEGRCVEHRKLLKSIQVRRAENKAAAAAKESHQAWVRAHGTHNSSRGESSKK